MPTRDADKWDLIPYDKARRAWEALPPEEREDTLPGRYLPRRLIGKEEAETRPHPPMPKPARPGCCPRCGWPRDGRGFVRLPFPRWHELSGRAICCPVCWPWPFGHAAEGALSGRAHQIAALWDKEEARVRA